MRRSREKKHTNHERWLVSYADFITLLFAFFVVMYAASSVDRQKMTAVAASIEGAFQKMGVFQGQSHVSSATIQHPPTAPELQALVQAAVETRIREQGIAPRDLARLRSEIEQALNQEINKGSITVRTGPDGLIISLSELSFFGSGSATMRKNAQESFGRIANLLAERRCGVRVEGHTDNVPIRTSEFKSNWDLSTARATAIVKSLIDLYHFDPALLSAAGYGEYHPVASNDSAAGRQQNRRVDLVVLSHEDALRLGSSGNQTARAQPAPAQPSPAETSSEQRP
jgi:chemotaxis protein MotB